MSEQEAYERKLGFGSSLESDGRAAEEPPSTETMSFVDLAMLSLLESVPMTGYALRKVMFTQFRLKTSFGTLYPRLRSLEKSGVIKFSENAGAHSARKSGINYELSPYGKKVLALNLKVFQEFLKRVQFPVTKSVQHEEL